MRDFDPDAWRTLSRLYGPLVYRWARQSHLQPQDAADLVQNVFVSVFRGIARFSHDRPEASFRAWLRTITRNAVREMRRRQAARPVGAAGGSDAYRSLQQQPEREGANDVEPVPADEDSETGLAHRALQLVRETLDERTWNVFRRTVLGEEPPAEVAADLGMTANAVRQAKYRVLCRLRDLLADG